MTQLSQTDYNNLTTRRTNILSELAGMTSTSTGAKANASQPGSVDHVGYKDGLYRELKAIEELLLAYDEENATGGAFGAAIISEGTV